MYRSLAGLVACSAVCAAGAAPSLATLRGANGLLAYEAQIGKHAQLFEINADGSGTHQLTDFADSDAVWADWSPSGKRIVFERDVFSGARCCSRALIETMNADGGGLRVLTPTGLNGRPSWSPDGKLIVFSTLQPGKKATLSLMAPNGGGVRQLVSTPLPATGQESGLNSPSFSPDGKQIAFVWIKRAGSAIFTINTSGGELKQLTPWKNGVADKIDWSPDGSRIGFSSPEFGRPGVSSNVFTVRADGSGGLLKLTDSRGGNINNGFDCWSPDGTKIAFASNRNGTYEIYTMTATGRGVAQLTHGPQAHHAAWAGNA
jgi:Tol biopolymer transport system component